MTTTDDTRRPGPAPKARRPTARRLSLLAASTVAALLLYPATLRAWGAGVHATLDARAHEAMTHRAKDAIDRSFLIYGSFGPDVWYILEDDFMSDLCGSACGPEDGAMANECWGDYHPDYYFNYTRTLLALSRSLEAVSYALGYGGHAVGDYRGHLEYIIPGWRDPQGDGAIPLDRHSVYDSAAGALVFNTQGLQGYPSRFTIDTLTWGYDLGFLTADNLTPGEAQRDPLAGLSVAVEESRTGRRTVAWNGLLNHNRLSVADLTAMMDGVAVTTASEGILAGVYGLRQWDSTGAQYPVNVEDGHVAMTCATDLASRNEGADGFGTVMPCQVNLAAASGLAQWDSYLTPAADTGDAIAVNTDTVALWLQRLAHDYTNGQVRLDDDAVFEIDPQTGKSTADLVGIDGNHFTQGLTMPQIVEGVLKRNVEDIRARLLENPHVLGTVLQSGLPPLDKARFVQMGFPYRPRLSAWPDTLPWEGQPKTLSPPGPGPFARVLVPVDMRPEQDNAAPELVFPYYLARITVDLSGMEGAGLVRGRVAYLDGANGQTLAEQGAFSLTAPQVALTEPTAMTALDTLGDQAVLAVLMDNTTGWSYLSGQTSAKAVLALDLALAVTDEATPPYNLVLDITLTPLCEKPADLLATPAPATVGQCSLPQPTGKDGGCHGGIPLWTTAALLLMALRRGRKKTGRSGLRSDPSLAMK